VNWSSIGFNSFPFKRDTVFVFFFFFYKLDMNYLNTWMTSVKNRYMVILLKTKIKKNYKNMSIKIGKKKM